MDMTEAQKTALAPSHGIEVEQRWIAGNKALWREGVFWEQWIWM